MFTLVTLGLIVGIVYLYLKIQVPDLSRYDFPVAPLVLERDAVSEGHEQVLERLRAYHQGGSKNVTIARKNIENTFAQEVDAEIQPVDAHGMPAEWIIAAGADTRRRLLYIHGGAFMVGSPKTYRFITAELSRRAGVAVLAIDYRMRPEFKITDCHQDAQTAYRWILSHGPSGAHTTGEDLIIDSPASELYVAGDSAGGNLTLSVIAWARNNNLQPANAAIAIAPLTDSSFSSPTWRSNLDTDPFLGPNFAPLLKIPLFLTRIGASLGAGAWCADPLISPIFGDLGGLPPTLIQASCDEMLFGDSQRYANKAQVEGGNVTLQLWPTMVHVFQLFAPQLPEAMDALDRIAKFIDAHHVALDED